MRITNQMMINSTMSNIQVNKNQLNTMDTQLSTQKKINKPSDDPIIAIRALRLRSSLEQVTQYLDKNIPDADAWLDTTQGALDEAYSILTKMYDYCNQGSSDQNSSSERTTIVESLQQLKTTFYAEGDVEDAGRYCFSGFNTDTPLTYQSDESAADVDYIITEEFNKESLDTKVAYENFYETDDILNLKYEVDSDGNVVTPNIKEVHRVRLGYKDIDSDIDGTKAFKLTVTDASGNKTTYNVSLISDVAKKNGTTTEMLQDNYIPGEDEIVFNNVTGELLIGSNKYTELYNASSFSFTYEKSNFQKGDLNPTMYYDCVNNNPDDHYYKQVYKKVDEDIEYNINFSQKIKINTEANDAFNIDVGREIDDIVNAVNNVVDIDEQISKVESMMGESKYSDATSQGKLAAMKEGLTKQKELAEEQMTAAFEHGIGAMQDFQQQVSLAKADVGNRITRLDLTKSRLTEQKTNFTNLKSQNEDIDLEEVVVGYSAAQLVYNASLTAASKVVQQTLLDFL